MKNTTFPMDHLAFCKSPALENLQPRFLKIRAQTHMYETWGDD